MNWSNGGGISSWSILSKLKTPKAFRMTRRHADCNDKGVSIEIKVEKNVGKYLEYPVLITNHSFGIEWQLIFGYTRNPPKNGIIGKDFVISLALHEMNFQISAVQKRKKIWSVLPKNPFLRVYPKPRFRG